MISTHPSYPVRVSRIVEPIGHITHAVRSCPRCGCNIGISDGMLAGIESIICKGKLGTCNGHFYLRGDRLEFVGTVNSKLNGREPHANTN